MIEFKIEKINSGIRLDKFLAEKNINHSRGEIARMIRDEKISVNKKTVKPSYRLEESDLIEIKDLPEKGEKISAEKNVLKKIKIVYADENFIIIDKPAGLQVHPSFKNEPETLVNGLVAKFPEIIAVHDDSSEAEARPGIVHRLDKETSGLMVVARKQEAFNFLKKKFQKRQVRKEYVALVEGIVFPKNGVIKKALARSSDYRKQIIAGKKTKTIIRDAETFYETMKNCGDKTLLLVKPKTGRTHQIRVHLASIGHPVVGDRLYGFKEQRMKAVVYGRHFLHASGIKFEFFGQDFSFHSELSREFKKVSGC